MKAIKQVMKKDQEPYRVPKRVQDVIPIKCMWSDGIFLVGTRYSKTFKFTDINYMVASQEAQKKLFLAYAALINSLDCGATTKITLNNRHLNRKNFADTVLIGVLHWDFLLVFFYVPIGYHIICPIKMHQLRKESKIMFVNINPVLTAV